MSLTIKVYCLWVKKNMSKPFTIVHTEASISLGGQGIRILHEALWMRDRGHRLIVVAPPQSGLAREAAKAGLETQPLRFAKSTQLGDCLRLVRILRRIRPDILNTHSSIDAWVGALAGRWCHIPAIIRTRHLSTPVRTHVLNRYLYRTLYDHIFTTGACTTDRLVSDLHLAASRVSTVATGIAPPARLPDREDARQAMCQALALGAQTRFLGCLAVLRSWKGHLILLEAFRHIREQIPHHLLVIGEGSQRPILEQKIDAWGLRKRVHLLGHRTDIWHVLRALDIKVLASTSSEGISQALLQAQFAGCAVIGSDCGGIPEIICHEKTGLLVPKGHAKPLGQAVLRLIADRPFAECLAHHAHQHAVRYHTMDAMGHKILTLYRSLLPAEA
jgi:glycosyltransferase involved in cell wall biosynthesis